MQKTNNPQCRTIRQPPTQPQVTPNMPTHQQPPAQTLGGGGARHTCCDIINLSVCTSGWVWAVAFSCWVLATRNRIHECATTHHNNSSRRKLEVDKIEGADRREREGEGREEDRKQKTERSKDNKQQEKKKEAEKKRTRRQRLAPRRGPR